MSFIAKKVSTSIVPINNINNFLSWSPPTSLVVWVQRFEFSPGGWHVIVQVVAATPTLLGEKVDKTVKVGEERFGPNLGISWRLESKIEWLHLFV